ncbi:MAG TPA: GIY-YIG nuclease family protein [Gammaproteobacteria bacterium]
MEWYLYILDCDGRYYTGITTDPRRRLEEHRAGKSRSAKFMRVTRSQELVYSVGIGDKSLALRAEARLKKLPRIRKEQVVSDAPARARLLELLDLAESEKTVSEVSS